MNSKLNYFKHEFFLLHKITTEQIFDSQNVPLFISIDEVGRGCVAGSVVSCVSLWIDPTFLAGNLNTQHQQNWLKLINDSKKLSEKKRQECFNIILDDYNISHSNISAANTNLVSTISQLVESQQKLHFKAEEFSDISGYKISQNKLNCLHFVIGQASPAEIDELNIWNAVQVSIARALLELQKQLHVLFPQLEPYLSKAIILMDGKHFIKVPKEFESNLQVTVTQADGLFISVGFSSIVAKVFRDTEMIQKDKSFPIFGFAKHKGYGTATHLTAIQSHGICELHRKSFLSNYLKP